MEEKKRYKATDVKVDGPFDGWIIEELDEDEYEKEAAKEQEVKKAAPPGKLTPEELEKKRNEQLNKIKDLIEQKKKLKAAADAKVNLSVDSENANSQEDIEAMLEKKSKETGIPVEVLRMIEEKKKEIRARKKADSEGNGNKNNKPGGGVEIADTVKKRREEEAAKEYYEERQERKDTSRSAESSNLEQ